MDLDLLFPENTQKPRRQKISSSLVQTLPASWTRAEVFNTEGIFYLRDVTKFVPFTTREILRMVNATSNAEDVTGVWRPLRGKAYLVNLRPFFLWCYFRWHGRPFAEEQEENHNGT